MSKQMLTLGYIQPWCSQLKTPGRSYLFSVSGSQEWGSGFDKSRIRKNPECQFVGDTPGQLMRSAGLSLPSVLPWYPAWLPPPAVGHREAEKALC